MCVLLPAHASCGIHASVSFLPFVAYFCSSLFSVFGEGVQRAMMEAMRKALEVPHMTFCDEIIADRLSLLRSDLREASERRGIKLSYLPLIVKVGRRKKNTFPRHTRTAREENCKFSRANPAWENKNNSKSCVHAHVGENFTGIDGVRRRG